MSVAGKLRVTAGGRILLEGARLALRPGGVRAPVFFRLPLRRRALVG